jgi:crossover junction endodeoxyribonuclease RuvC
MIILGIDPGTERIGYGIIKKERAKLEFLSAGLLHVGKEKDKKMQEAKRHMDSLIAEWRPDVLAVEKLFFAKNQKTAIGVAQMRGVILLSGAEHALTLAEYTPNEVKSGLTGYGFADKKAVLKMVRLILKRPDLNFIDDASDALAIAIHASSDRTILA